MATHFTILAWKIPTDREPVGSPWGRKESDSTKATYHTHIYVHREGNLIIFFSVNLIMASF